MTPSNYYSYGLNEVFINCITWKYSSVKCINIPYWIIIKNLYNITTPMKFIKYINKWVDFEPSINNKNIFEIKSLCFIKIKVETFTVYEEVAKCLCYQSYDHTMYISYCNNRPKCVRCDLNHNSVTCIKVHDISAKCVLCNENHASNYRDYIVFKQQQLRNQSSSQRKNKIIDKKKIQIVSIIKFLSTPQN